MSWQLKYFGYVKCRSDLWEDIFGTLVLRKRGTGVSEYEGRYMILKTPSAIEMYNK